MVVAIAAAASRSLLTGQDFGRSLEEELPTVIGQTIGNMVAAGATQESGPHIDRWIAEDFNSSGRMSAEAASYWSPRCKLVSQLRCWVRVAWREDGSTREGWWGQLLTMPTDSCLEGAGGPVPLRDVEWGEVSTSRVKGGIAGRPRQMIDAKDEILAGLRGTQLNWELRESKWSVVGLFENEPVQVVRIVNPFGPPPRP